MCNPLVSIIIPNYNKSIYLRETLNSVLAQTYVNWECIIVDDHSTDISRKILHSFVEIDKRIQLYIRPKELTKGGNVCRNYAMSLSQGYYCIFLDSDDVLASFCLEQRIKSIESFPNNDFWVFRSLLFNQTPSDANKLWNVETEEADLIRFLRMDALWQTTGPIYKKSFVEKLNGFNESLAFWQDYDLHLRAIISGGKYLKLFSLPPDVYIREGDKESLSRSTPFTADKEILGKRIEFFKSIEDYPSPRENPFSKEGATTRLAVLYFFVAQYWIKHGDFERFMLEWKEIHCHITNSGTLYFLGIVHIALVKIAIKYSIAQPIKVGFQKLFTAQLLDYYSMEKTSLGKASYFHKAFSQFK